MYTVPRVIGPSQIAKVDNDCMCSLTMSPKIWGSEDLQSPKGEIITTSSGGHVLW
jgi:hypothetical protein